MVLWIHPQPRLQLFRECLKLTMREISFVTSIGRAICTVTTIGLSKFIQKKEG